jgi:predicted amidohydrolase YtcJ
MSKTMLAVFLALSLAASSLIQGTISAEVLDEGRNRPDLILYHGKIFTADPAAPFAQALAIRGDRIAAVGNDDAILGLAGEASRKVDLGGRTVIPGINDAHDHFFGGSSGVRVVLDPAIRDPGIPALVEAVRRAAQAAPPGAWLNGKVGPALVRNPSGVRVALDQAAGDHPVLLFAWWGHGAITNTKGLESLGIKDDAPDPAGGRFDRDGSGRLTGLLEEYAATLAHLRVQANVPVERTIEALRKYADGRLRRGVTTVQLMAHFDPEPFVRALCEAQLSIRVRAIKWPMPDPHGLGLGAYERVERHPTPLITVSGTKFVLDGTPIDQLAFQRRPYPDRPDWRGRLNFPREKLREILASALENNDQLILHVVGEATADVVLTEMERLATPTRWALLRVRLEHANGITGPNVDRARQLGIVIAQPRIETAPLRTLLSHGIPLAFGSDAMPDPFDALLRATTVARSPGESVTQEEFAATTVARAGEVLTREEFVGLMTRGSAFAEFTERDKGMLSQGMWADIAVLSRDIFTCPDEALAGTESVLTMIGGKVAYDARALDMKGPVPSRR